MMKKKIIYILILLVLTISIIFIVGAVTINREEAIKLLDENMLETSKNVRIFEKESGNNYENYERETLKLDNIEYCRIKMTGEEDYNYINWIDLEAKKDIVVFINEKIYNSSTLEVEPILINYSEKAVEYFKDTSYEFEYVKKENVQNEKCAVLRAYKANEADNNYEEMKVWVNMETGDCLKAEYFLNEKDFSKPEEPTSILEFTYSYDSVKIEEIKEIKEEDYPDFKYTYLY